MEYELDQTGEDEDDAGDDCNIGGDSILTHRRAGLGDQHLLSPRETQGRTDATRECWDLTNTGWQTAHAGLRRPYPRSRPANTPSSRKIRLTIAKEDA